MIASTSSEASGGTSAGALADNVADNSAGDSGGTLASGSAGTLRGTCLCGAVAYRAEGPAEYASHCYCTMCQKQHGAGAGSYANVGTAGFAFERGAELVTEYASSDDGRRGFCSVCGSTLFWRSTQTPDRIALTLGTLEPEYDGPVTHELHTDTKPRWLPTRQAADGG